MTLPRCPDCRAELGEPLEYVDHAVEDIEPGHLVVRLYRQARYRCPGCGQLHLARPPGILPNARFGPNLALLVVMLRLRGMDLDALAELMGHESLETTRIYATLANEELRKRYVACGLLGAASGNGDPQKPQPSPIVLPGNGAEVARVLRKLGRRGRSK